MVQYLVRKQRQLAGILHIQLLKLLQLESVVNINIASRSRYRMLEAEGNM